MWLCLNDAFLSIVKKDCPKDSLLVRARRPGDIEKVFGPDVKVKRSTNSEYFLQKFQGQHRGPCVAYRLHEGVECDECAAKS